MTANTYLAALKKLRLTHASPRTAKILGIDLRSSSASRCRPIPKPIEKLLELLHFARIPEEWR